MFFIHTFSMIKVFKKREEVEQLWKIYNQKNITEKKVFRINEFSDKGVRLVIRDLEKQRKRFEKVTTEVEIIVTPYKLLHNGEALGRLTTEEEYTEAIQELRKILHEIWDTTEVDLQDAELNRIDVTYDIVTPSQKYTREIIAALKVMHALTQKTLEESHTQVIIYEDALSDLVIGRTISFFGCKLKLSLSQIQTYLKCLKHTCLNHLNLEVKLAIGKFVKDYQYEMTQCVFTSDSISYLRLNTENRENNLALFNHSDMTEIFVRFFDEIWESSDGKCLSESTEIKHFFDHMIQNTEIQSGISFSF